MRALSLASIALLSLAALARGETADCRKAISQETTQRLFAVLNHPPSEPQCKFEGLSTNLGRMEARWSHAGVMLPAINVVARECAPPLSESVGAFGVVTPPEIVRQCPSVGRQIERFKEELATEVAAGAIGNLDDPLFRTARLLFMAIILVSLGLALRGGMDLANRDRRWVVVGAVSFAAALGLRAALPFSIGNWYSEVLPVSGPPPWPRFGPGLYAFQSLLRDADLWTPAALAVSQLVLGSLALPLLLGVLWELRVGLEAASLTLLLLVCAPFHARLSATTSEHVLASTLCLGLLLSWLRAMRAGGATWWLLTCLLFPAVCLTRVDMAVQALLVLVWPFLLDKIERQQRPPPRAIWLRLAALALVVVATLWIVYRYVALPSHHPMPGEGRLLVLRQLLPQYWQLATGEPAWMSLPAVLLAVLGAIVMLVRRPILLMRVAGTVVIAFVALARGFLPDELLGARYFLLTIAIFLIASGQGFEALLDIVPRRYRPGFAVAAMVVIGVWSAAAGRTAYAVRYAFQDEYTFLRQALAKLPDGCTVYAVPIRDEAFPVDLDCCLDMRRSPLVLDFPKLHFDELPQDPASIFAAASCVAYYESVSCSIVDDPQDRSVHGRAEKAVPFFQQRCAEAHQNGRLRLVAETTTSPRAVVDFFHGRPPAARLYRWTP
ncbi:MAG: hypothetical protein HY270_09370 [Deltaproteobacteria bacterium]|nr:hypothetical protein [Deltaproteobacteria bacterium]